MMVATRSIVECSASEISASEPMAMPTTSLAAAMPPLARIDIAATEDFEAGALAGMAVMGCGLAARGLTSSSHPQPQSLLARRSEFIANCSEFNERRRYIVTTILPRCL